MNSLRRTPTIGILMFPWASSGPFTFVEELLEILKPITHKLYVFTGGSERVVRKNSAEVVDCGFKLHYVEKSCRPFLSRLDWILKSLMFQMSASLFFVMNMRRIDAVLFLAHPYETVPILVARICGIRTVEVVTRGSHTNGHGLALLSALSEKLAFCLCHAIAIESESLITNIKCQAHRKKVIGLSSRYVDLNTFAPRIPFGDRKRSIAYVGRFREEKGVMDFVRAIPGMVRRCRGEVSLVGAGDLDADIIACIETFDEDVRHNVKLHGWVTKEELAEILGCTSILIHPSESEGLPTIVLQAMASGVIVVASGVGGIPDVITDGVTGFLLPDRNPKSIESRVCAIFDMPSAHLISEEARKRVEEHFTLEAAVLRYTSILERLLREDIAPPSVEH